MGARFRSRRRDDVDRRCRGGAVERERGVGGNGRSQQPPELLVGRWRVQVRGRRTNLDLVWSLRHASHRPHRHPSVEPGYRLRRGGRSFVGTERRARRLQDRGRRTDVGKGSLRRRQHRRNGSRDGSEGPSDTVRGDVPAAAKSVGIQRRRSRQRYLPQPRWWQQLEPPVQRFATRRQGTHRPRHLSSRSACDLRGRGGGRP